MVYSCLGSYRSPSMEGIGVLTIGPQHEPRPPLGQRQTPRPSPPTHDSNERDSWPPDWTIISSVSIAIEYHAHAHAPQGSMVVLVGLAPSGHASEHLSQPATGRTVVVYRLALYI